MRAQILKLMRLRNVIHLRHWGTLVSQWCGSVIDDVRVTSWNVSVANDRTHLFLDTVSDVLEYSSRLLTHIYFQKCVRTCTKLIKIAIANVFGAKYNISALEIPHFALLWQH